MPPCLDFGRTSADEIKVASQVTTLDGDLVLLGIPKSVSQSTQARPCAVKCTNTPSLLQEAVAVMFPGKWRTAGPGLPCGFLLAIEMDGASKMLSRLHKRSVGTGQGCSTE